MTDAQPVEFPVYIIDGRTTVLTDQGRAIVDDNTIRYGERRWVPPDEAKTAYWEGWQHLGRDVEGDALLWLPTPAVPADAGHTCTEERSPNA